MWCSVRADVTWCVNRIYWCISNETRPRHGPVPLLTQPPLAPAVQQRSVGRLAAENDSEAVAAAFNVHLSTVYRPQQRLTAISAAEDHVWQHIDRILVSSAIIGRFVPDANETGKNTIGTTRCPSVVRWCVDDWYIDLQNCRQARGPVLTHGHRPTHLQCAQTRVY